MSGDLHEPILVIETMPLSPARAMQPASSLIKDLAGEALAHYAALGVIVDRIRLTPAF